MQMVSKGRRQMGLWQYARPDLRQETYRGRRVDGALAERTGLGLNSLAVRLWERLASQGRNDEVVDTRPGFFLFITSSCGNRGPTLLPA